MTKKNSNIYRITDPLMEPYFIQYDQHCYTVMKKVTAGNTGRVREQLIGYYSQLESCLDSIAEDAINAAISINKLKKKKCKTEKLKLAGYKKIVDWNDPMHVYGSQKKKVESLGGINDNKSLSKKFHITNNIIEWSIIHEMALTIEDVLARRTRSIFLDAKESKRIAPEVAKKMAEVLEKDQKWIDEELKNFNKLIKNYIV